MTGADYLSIIVAAVLLPFLVALFTRPEMTSARKRGVVIIASIVVGALTAIVTGQIDAIPAEFSVWITRILGWIAAIALASQAAYKLLEDPVKALEEATSSK